MANGILLERNERMTDKPWKPDWAVITILAMFVGGALLIWHQVLQPIVDFLK
jgi:hypothetical protein